MHTSAYREADRSSTIRAACHSKAGYWTMTQAKTAADRRQSKGAPKLYVYRCPHCPRYHLTKQAPK